MYVECMWVCYLILFIELNITEELVGILCLGLSNNFQ